MARKPKVGSKAWEASLMNDPTYAKNTLLDLAKRAEAGNEQAVENLMGWLQKFPDMRNLIRSLDDLATKAEQAWVERLSGENLLSRTALEEELSSMKAELLGPNPSVTDKLLASSVIVSYLSYQRSALSAAQLADQVHLRTAREKVLAIAQKRFQDAMRFWKLHTEKKNSNPTIKAKLKLFDPAVG
jgi:hypothetical protein